MKHLMSAVVPNWGFHIPVLLWALVFASGAWAQADAVAQSEISDALTSSRNSSEVQLNLSSSQYVRSSETYFRDGANSQSTSWSLGWKAKTSARGFYGQVDARNDYVAEEDHSYVKPFSLSAGYQSDFVRAGLGQEKYDWSRGDEFWRLGLWQPRFMDDPIRRETAGFAGAHLEVKRSHWTFAAMASPIWMPDVGPDFDVKGSQFVSKNPWFRPPTSVVFLDEDLTDVRYSLEKPNINEIINHPMAVAKFELRPSSDQFFSLSAGYKPINQLMIGFPIKLILEDPDYAEIDVQTRVLYHQLVTLEGGWQSESGWKSWWSLTSERPFRDDPPVEWTTQEVDDALIGMVMVGKDIRGSGVNATHLYVSYLRVEGGRAEDRGELVGAESLFEDRYLFNDAIQVGLKHSMPWLGRKFLTRLSASAIYDFAQHGVLAQVQLHQPFSREWSAQMSADFIGLIDQNGKLDDGFTANYRANDRVSMGVQYVF